MTTFKRSLPEILPQHSTVSGSDLYSGLCRELQDGGEFASRHFQIDRQSAQVCAAHGG